MAVVVEDLLLKPCYELRLVFTEWLAHSQQHTSGEKHFEAGPSYRRFSVTQAFQLNQVGSARLTWDVIS